jgi:hypothetical protein
MALKRKCYGSDDLEEALKRIDAGEKIALVSGLLQYVNSSSIYNFTFLLCPLNLLPKLSTVALL